MTALERDLLEREADHICITGDITNLGLADEFQAAGLWLTKLTKPEKVTFVPGNHDAYIAASLEAMREHFGPWLPDAYPSVTQQNGVLFVGVSTAVATPPLLATGRTGQGQLARLDTILGETAGKGLFRVLLIHHPPAPGVVRRRKALTDAPALLRVLRDRGMDLVLHGHGHRAAHYEVKSRSGPIQVFGAGSATLAHQDTASTGHYHEFELDSDRGELRVAHRHYRPDIGCFITTSEVNVGNELRGVSEDSV